MKQNNLVKMAMIATVLMGAPVAQATVLFEKTVPMTFDLRTTHLRYSNAGYGEFYVVKLLVPELADHTFLNHRNPGAEAPCMATYDVSTVDEVIQGRPETLLVPVKITLTKDTYRTDNQDKTVCSVTMKETVSANVRGFNFIHTRSVTTEDRVEEDCR